MTKLLLAFLLSIASALAQGSLLGQPACNAQPATGTGWTTATSVNATQVLASNVSGAQVLVTIDQGSTLTVGAIQFQGDPGDGNFVNLASWQVVDPTTPPFAAISMPYTLQVSTNKQFLVLMAGMYRLQLKLTTAITGTATVTPYTTMACYQLPVSYQGTAANLLATVSQATASSLNANVSQATGSNLHVQVDTAPSTAVTNAGTFAVQAAQNTASNLNAAVVGTLSNNGAAATTNRAAVLPGVVQTDPANGSAFTQGRDAAPNVDTAGNLWASIQPGLRPASYEASANFAASSTTDNACIYGNATDTVVLYGASVSGIQTTASVINVQLIRRSAAESGGTSANMTAVRGDVTNYAAASTTPVSYTGTGPSVGAAVGTVDQAYTAFLTSASTQPNDIYLWDGRLKPQILIGTGQGLCINIGNAALTGGTMNVTFRWLEIKNITE